MWIIIFKFLSTADLSSFQQQWEEKNDSLVYFQVAGKFVLPWVFFIYLQVIYIHLLWGSCDPKRFLNNSHLIPKTAVRGEAEKLASGLHSQKPTVWGWKRTLSPQAALALDRGAKAMEPPLHARRPGSQGAERTPGAHYPAHLRPHLLGVWFLSDFISDIKPNLTSI